MGACCTKQPKEPQRRDTVDFDGVVDLEGATYAGTKEFVPRPRIGKVVRVYDGDTVWIASSSSERHSCRLYGIDCAEMRSKDVTERQEANAARSFLLKILPEDGMVCMAVQGRDKYGRLLVRLSTFQHEDISRSMLNAGYAVPYDGGTKAVTDWAAFRARREQRAPLR